MVKLPIEVGHAKSMCVVSCDHCNYYKLVKGQRYNVLVITRRSELQVSLDADLHKVNFNIAYVDSEYKCSMIINDFRPDYVVIDCTTFKERYHQIAKHLFEDHRLPVVRIILAGEKCELPEKCDKRFFAFIKSNFTTIELADHLENLNF